MVDGVEAFHDCIERSSVAVLDGLPIRIDHHRNDLLYLVRLNEFTYGLPGQPFVRSDLPDAGPSIDGCCDTDSPGTLPGRTGVPEALFFLLALGL
jgi:hypothetical protein